MDIEEKQESAKLILQLYELRREQKMRESRDWWFGFNPKSIQDVMSAIMSPDGWKLRQAMGYWEMAAALVNHGVIDAQMFYDTNGEHLYLFVKLQPFLKEMRAAQPNTLLQLEKLILGMPDAEKTIASVRQQIEAWKR